MAYVFFPARETNFFPPGPPYLAGLRGMRGLGDYAADLAAYNADMRKWRLESLAYNKAIAFNAAKVKVIDANFAAAWKAYLADKAAWDNEYAAYLVAYKSWVAANQDNAARSMKIADAYGLNLTQGFYLSGACISQADHDAYARSCTVVKGLGHLRGLGSTNSDCGMKQLPICTPAPSVRAKPVPPTRAAYPAAPAPLRAMPIAPTAPATTTPASSGGGGGSPTTHPDTVSLPVTVPDASVAPTADDSKYGNVLMNGLIIVAVLGGGYLVYRTLKKPKAQAA